MNTPSFEASYRAFMTALFVGIADTFLSLIYNIAYRSTRHYFSSTLLNVSYLIFGMLFIFCLLGLIYMLVLHIFRNGDFIFFLLISVLTILAIWSLHSGNFSDDPMESASLRGEYTGVTVIAGLCAAIAIPLLHRSRKFEQYVV